MNGIVNLIKYFQSDENYVSYTEFSEFWFSLSMEDKAYFKTVNLETGLLPDGCKQEG